MGQIRKVNQQDVNALKKVIDTSGLFDSSLLEEMMEDYFNNPSTNDIWLTYESNTVPIAVVYCAPERLTDGTYNLYLIAIRKQEQGTGIGTAIMNFIEEFLKAKGERIVLVETSGLPEFELTRKFYDQCGYIREAVIRDFYCKGEDKVVFWKKLNN